MIRPSGAGLCVLPGKSRDGDACQSDLDCISLVYFHVVFTLPGDLRELARRNRALVFDLLLKSAAVYLPVDGLAVIVPVLRGHERATPGGA